MSKVDILREKYPITERTFNKLNLSDTTPTKKYLKYMVEMWFEKSKEIGTTTTLIEEVQKFDRLLPYIPLKDIYHHEYKTFDFLRAMNEKAEQVKDEKTFIREEHCDVIFEDDNHLLVRPKTFRGSLKYGTNTKWCTASKNNPQTFERYSKNGLLFYLIDKINTEDTKFSKIAFYMDKSVDPVVGEILLYDSKDNQISTTNILKSGWNDFDFMKYTFYFRQMALNHFNLLKSKEFVSNTIKSLMKIDFEGLNEHIKNLKNSEKVDNFISDFQDNLLLFDNKIKKLTNGN
jgi:hypothetical protein